MDEGKSQIKADVLAILVVELFHLRGDDEEDVWDVRIGWVYLMHIFCGFGVIVADASKILVDFFIGNILLIDIYEIFRQVSVLVVFLIEPIEEFSQGDLILRTNGAHHVVVLGLGDFEAITDDSASGNVGYFHWQTFDELFNVRISLIVNVNGLYLVGAT